VIGHEIFGLDPALERLVGAAERSDTVAFLADYPLINWTTHIIQAGGLTF
jgi:hypothetical protein